MSTVKLFVSNKDFHEVSVAVNKSGVKYYPIRKRVLWKDNSGTRGYVFEMDRDHPIVSFIILKYGLEELT